MGRLQLYIIGGILLFGVLTGIYYSWRKGIEREALLEYNQAQIEQNIKDQQAMRDKLEAMDKKQREIEAANAADKKDFKDKMNSIASGIDITNDRPASNLLKDTVKRLQEVPK
jgi:hypothetical protein